MNNKLIITRRLIGLLFVILVWFGLGSAVYSFALGSIAGGAIKLVITLAILGVFVQGRVVRSLVGRPIQGLGIMVFSLIAFILIYDGIQNLSNNQTSLLGTVYLPGVIAIVSAIGAFILAGALILELGRLIISRV